MYWKVKWRRRQVAFSFFLYLFKQACHKLWYYWHLMCNKDTLRLKQVLSITPFLSTSKCSSAIATRSHDWEDNGLQHSIAYLYEIYMASFWLSVVCFWYFINKKWYHLSHTLLSLLKSNVIKRQPDCIRRGNTWTLLLFKAYLTCSKKQLCWHICCRASPHMYNLRDVLTVTLRLVEFIQPESNDSAFFADFNDYYC